MAKRFGRNQRRKLKQLLELTTAVSQMNADNITHLKGVLNQTALELRNVQRALEVSRREIYLMVEMGVKPHADIFPSSEGRRVGIGANMGTARPVRESMVTDLEQFAMLRGPEAQSALIKNIARQLTDGLLRQGYIR